jgi:hypothetical protein
MIENTTVATKTQIKYAVIHTTDVHDTPSPTEYDKELTSNQGVRPVICETLFSLSLPF